MNTHSSPFPAARVVALRASRAAFAPLPGPVRVPACLDLAREAAAAAWHYSLLSRAAWVRGDEVAARGWLAAARSAAADAVSARRGALGL